MLSPALRAFLHLLATAYAVTGAVMFVAPAWASANFAWRISPFIAMTVGGWCLGTAWAAFTAARRAHWPSMIGPIAYLALFGLIETAVLVTFRARVVTPSPLAWLYLITIGGTAVFAIAAIAEAWLRRPVLVAVGRPYGIGTLLLAVGFILLVGFLGYYGLTAVEGMRGLNAAIFPETMTPLSLRAFGAFYLSLALAVVPLLFARGTGNVAAHGFAMYLLLVFITIAAFVFIGQFNFAARPTQMIYIGIYLLVALVVGIFMLRNGTGAQKA